MKFRFTIANRLILGFGILSLIVIIGSILTYYSLIRNISINEEIQNVHTPTVFYLNDLNRRISNSRLLIKNWVLIDKTNENSIYKQQLIDLHSKNFPEIDNKLLSISSRWSENERNAYIGIAANIRDSLFELHQSLVIEKLATYNDYQDSLKYSQVVDDIANENNIMSLTNNILTDLEELLQTHSQESVAGIHEMKNSFENFKASVLIVGSISVFVAFFTALFTIWSLIVPIKELKKVLVTIGQGILPRNTMRKRSDEIGQMSEAIDHLVVGLKRTSEFSLEIGQSNFDTEFKPLSKKDKLGNSLLTMRENLKKATNEEVKRKEEDEQRNWFSRGIAHFSEIMRTSNDNLEELSYEVVRNIVEYVNANQAGIFIYNDTDKDNKFLEITAAYAYERKKHASKRIELGEGLIGACFLEKETIFLTKVPDNYLNITSGLGKSNPRCLLITPLIINDEVFGVMELAAFDILTKNQIEFVEKISESLASTISYVNVNIRTAQLLKDSQLKSEQLAVQEEQMRMSMTEIQETQKKTDIQIKDLKNKVELFESSILVLEIDIQGSITRANTKLLKILNIRIDEIIGKKIRDIIDITEMNNFDTIWKDLQSGEKRDMKIRWKNNFINIVIILTISPIFDVVTNEITEYIALGKH